MGAFTAGFFSRRVSWPGLVSMAIVAILLRVPRMPEAASGGPAHLDIVHTNNVNGHLFGCPT